MAENKNKTDSLVNGCPAESENVVELSDAAVGTKAADSNSAKVEESAAPALQTVLKLEYAEKKAEEKSHRDSSPVLEQKNDIVKEDAAVSETTTAKTTATTSGSKGEVETGIEKLRGKLQNKDIEDSKVPEESLAEIIHESKSEKKGNAKILPGRVEKTAAEEILKEDTPSGDTESPVLNEKRKLEDTTEGTGTDEEPPVIDEIIAEEKDKAAEVGGAECPRQGLTSEVSEATNHSKSDENIAQVDEEDEEDDEEVMETEEPEEVEEDEEEDEEDDDDEDENENEQLELGIVGPPTAVSELINEEELRCAETVLLTEGRSGVENVQDHVAEWVQNSANSKVKELTIDEDENENENDHDRDDIKGSGAVTGDKKIKKNTENIEKNVEVLATRKSKRVVSNIIKRSIKCLNKIHAMDASSGIKGTEKATTGATKKGQNKVFEGEENTKSKECSGGDSPAAPPATRNQNRERRNHNHHQNHSSHNRNGDGDPPEGESEAYDVKKEPTSEPETDPEPERDALPELRKRTGSDRNKKLKTERERERERACKKRRSTDEIQSSNGKSKRACLEQREEFLSSIVGGEKVTTEELTVRAEQLRAELQALDQLARAKEKEWNEILSMRKLKEEAYLRIERRRQVVGFMEGNGQLNETSVIPSISLSLEPDWDNAKEKSNSTEATLSDKSITTPQVTSKQSENGQKESSDGQNSEPRQVGEGRQGPMVDVRTIIADYRLRHPETVPRRSRRMRNSVNVGLGAGGAMVENTHVGADSRPSSTDSCKSSSNATDPSNSMSFKDVLVQFAKLSQQQGEAVKTPQNYPDVTLHPVLPSPAAPQTAAIQQSGSLLHGILTKSQSPRPTTFSPTLARLLTAPERERCNPIATSTPQQTTATQHLLQAYQGTNPVSISDLLSSSKARTEITITPVVNTPIPQSHSNSLIHVEDVEEETTVIEERGRSSNARDDSPPRCQGCQDRAAQFVCAGCGNQWYCSRECQVSAWDEHSEVCSG